jgi:hypothetical protein
MKNTKPENKTFSARPPMNKPPESDVVREPMVIPTKRTDEETLRELERVDAITEVPSRAAAKAIGIEAKKVLQPWEVEDQNSITTCTFRLPSAIVAKLKYLAGTTFGETQTSIMIGILGKNLDKMLKERQKGD